MSHHSWLGTDFHKTLDERREEEFGIITRNALKN
jgi:hypothetical protein